MMMNEKSEQQINYERKLQALGYGPGTSGRESTQKVSDTIPDSLVSSFGGVVGDYAAYINSISPALNEHTAFLGALAFCSFCASRRYRTESNLTPELYLVALCPSGGGKDLPRKVNMEMAHEIGASDNVVLDIASGEGGEDAILDHAKLLAQIDEFDTILRAIAEDRGGNKESLIRFILTAYTSGGSYLKRRQKARGKESQDSKSICYRPGLTVFGTGIKSMFFAAMNERAMTNGMFARMLVCPCKSRDTVRDVTWEPIPATLSSRFKFIAGSADTKVGGVDTIRITDKPGVKPDPTVVKMDDEAKEELLRVTVEADTWYRSFDESEDGEPGRAIANRRREHVLRLALNRAISRDPYATAISRSDIRWGDRFVSWSQRAMLSAAAEYCFRNPFDELVQKARRYIARQQSVTRRDLYRLLHVKADEVQSVIDYLLTAGNIIEDEIEPNRFTRI